LVYIIFIYIYIYNNSIDYKYFNNLKKKQEESEN